jgi:transketolase
MGGFAAYPSAPGTSNAGTEGCALRREFVEALVEAAAVDERIVLLTGDLGFNALESFAERFPERFFNVGVAEQNMLGLSVGLAEAGFVPFAYSIATFASMRPYEFIRNGPVLHELPVRIVGMGGGLDYGHNGVTHYAVEDLALMRVQPELAVLAPADGAQTRRAVAAVGVIERPAYLRLEREGRPVHGLDGRFRLGRAELIGGGGDLAFVAVGSVAHEAVEAAERLAAEGIDATVAVVSSFNPSPVDDVAELLARVPAAISVEAHYLSGGLGSLLAEVVAERGLDCRLVRRGVEWMPRGESGGRAHLLAAHGLSAPQLAAAAIEALSLVG